MSTFDPMAAAMDWLDFYRGGSLSIVDLYALEAAVECSCEGMKVARGQAAISDYWRERLRSELAGELIALQAAGAGVAITYRVSEGGVVQATLYFGDDGKIVRSVCGPA